VSIRLVGLERVKARDQLQKSYPRDGIQPLPDPYKPGRVAPADVGISDPGAPLSFFALGDVGGVKAPSPQNAVSLAMERRQSEAAFVLVLGDVVYYNGQETDYMDQFYKPYAKLARPIIAFPGNHDGDPVPGDRSLSGFMENVCDSAPNIPRSWLRPGWVVPGELVGAQPQHRRERSPLPGRGRANR
jgi:Calcineurin-like phosphoesterase